LEHVTLAIVPVVLICLVVGAVLSCLVQVVAFEPILKRAQDVQKAEFQILVGGLGVEAALLAIVQKATQSAPYGFTESSFVITTFEWGPVRVSNIQLIIVIAGVVVGALTALWMRRSRTGLA